MQEEPKLSSVERKAILRKRSGVYLMADIAREIGIRDQNLRYYLRKKKIAGVAFKKNYTADDLVLIKRYFDGVTL